MKTWKLQLRITPEYYDRCFNANVKKFIEAPEEELAVIDNEMLSCLDPKQQICESNFVVVRENYKEFCNAAKDYMENNPLGDYMVYQVADGVESMNVGVTNYLYATIRERETFAV